MSRPVFPRRSFFRALAALGTAPAAASVRATTNASAGNGCIRPDARPPRHHVFIFKVAPDAMEIHKPSDLWIWLMSGRLATSGRTARACRRERDAFNLEQLQSGRPRFWAVVIDGGKSDLDRAAGGDA